MKIRNFFILFTVCMTLVTLAGCKVSEKKTQTEPYSLLDRMNASTESVFVEKGDHTFQLEPDEIKSVNGTYKNLLLATGLTRGYITVKLIDITDKKNQKVLRTDYITAGTSFVLRQLFNGTKTIKVEIANTGTTVNIVQLKFH